MYEWFHPSDDLKENYKRCVEFGTYFDKASLHLVIIPPLQLIFAMYLESNALRWPLSIVIIQPFIKVLIQKCEPQLLEDDKFKVSTK
jgi:hypothetical protein